jgi:hypothetical protein
LAIKFIKILWKKLLTSHLRATIYDHERGDKNDGDMTPITTRAWNRYDWAAPHLFHEDVIWIAHGNPAARILRAGYGGPGDGDGQAQQPAAVSAVGCGVAHRSGAAGEA